MRTIMDKKNKFENSILSKNNKNFYYITIKKIENYLYSNNYVPN